MRTSWRCARPAHRAHRDVLSARLRARAHPDELLKDDVKRAVGRARPRDRDAMQVFAMPQLDQVLDLLMPPQ